MEENFRWQRSNLVSIFLGSSLKNCDICLTRKNCEICLTRKILWEALFAKKKSWGFFDMIKLKEDYFDKVKLKKDLSPREIVRKFVPHEKIVRKFVWQENNSEIKKLRLAFTVFPSQKMFLVKSHNFLLSEVF